MNLSALSLRLTLYRLSVPYFLWTLMNPSDRYYPLIRYPRCSLSARLLR